MVPPTLMSVRYPAPWVDFPIELISSQVQMLRTTSTSFMMVYGHSRREN